MASYAHSSERDAEVRIIDRLRIQYEENGFAFTERPTRAELPDFFGSYIPDALARKPGQNVAIEVKSRPGPQTGTAVKDLQRLFAGRPDWQLQVVFTGADPLQSLSIPTAPATAIRPQVGEIRALVAQGHFRAAFIMAWSVLEAVVRALDRGREAGPLTPGAVVQALAMNGYIQPEMERRMRDLITLRNRVIHGDLAVEPAASDVNLIVSAVETALGDDHD
ncbi:MAG TPA: hypothetical protein VFE63_20865 [Roseiarcus sp.]|jgi:hypothetical protein|nr:hypothetical protein [Roseiarcus sp.]